MNVKNITIRSLKVLLGILVFVALLLVAALVVVHSQTFQRRLLKEATLALAEKLETNVAIDSVSFSLFHQFVHLYGVDIEDQQQRPMLQLDTLSVNMALRSLLQNEIKINHVQLAGMRAQLYKDSVNTPANFQFVIDAFKSKKKKGRKFTFEMQRCRLSRVMVHYQTKEKPYDHDLQLSLIDYRNKRKQHSIDIQGIVYQNDNHKPHRRTGKPKRGYFDEGHLDVHGDVHCVIDHFDKDSIHAVLTSASFLDQASGLDLQSLTLSATVKKSDIYLHQVEICLPNTKLTFDEAQLHLPHAASGEKLSYQTSTITGTTLLKDIAHPFAPVLGQFSIPLALSVDLSGDAETMRFRNVRVNTTDNKLTIAAVGDIQKLNQKRALTVNFHVNPMRAKGNVVQRIINQFPVKKFLMSQLNTLGNITYRGNFHVFWHREAFDGTLYTRPGNLHFTLNLNEDTKYLTGHINTDSIRLGQLASMPQLGKIACTADFTFDYSKPRTALVRKRLGGKLPIGNVTANVQEANYKKIKIKNLSATLKSNGAIAQGDVVLKGKHIDGLCSFTFTNTDSIHKMKVKPSLKFHKLTDEDKALKAQRKAEKAAAKERRKAEKAAAKQLKEQQKAEAKRKKQEAESAKE
ncbi:MAG: cell envelope integrity protein TolA [Bacteroidaceae bacterium]|nr:cell envelope integrity protein TolA [Bacteroidaceae bacterium]